MTFGAIRRTPVGGEVTFLTDELGELLNGVTLLVFGAVLLWPALDGLTWPIVLYAVASLTIIRMAPVAIAMLGTGARQPTVAFLGWFGPRGLASIVFAAIVVQGGRPPTREHDRPRDLRHRRPLRPRPRRHGSTTRQPLRLVVHITPVAARRPQWKASPPARTDGGGPSTRNARALTPDQDPASPDAG